MLLLVQGNTLPRGFVPPQTTYTASFTGCQVCSEAERTVLLLVTLMTSSLVYGGTIMVDAWYGMSGFPAVPSPIPTYSQTWFQMRVDASRRSI